MSEFPYYAHGALHELFVACQLTPGVVEVVLQADPYMAAEDKRVCGRWQLSRADRGDLKTQLDGSASTIICRIFGV